MKFKIRVSTFYYCSLERAFKTPMLCDLTKIHSGYGLMPKVVKTTGDDHWGQPRSSKKIYVEKSLTQLGGWAAIDKVVERVENTYWKIEVNEFKSWMLGFTKFVGEWQTTEIEKNKIRIDFTYTLYASNVLLYPFNWLFAHLFWKAYMKKVLENIRQMTNDGEPYLYN